MPVPRLRRRHLLGGAVCLAGTARAASPTYRVAFANATEAQGARLEGLGFTGFDVRRSFELAARTLPLEMLYYDNGGDAETAISNAVDAISHKVDLLIEYNPEASANPEIARRMTAAGIPVFAINYPVGDAPLYTADNFAAGKIAGQALGAFAKQSWPDDAPVAVILGDLGDPSDGMALRMKGITAGLHAELVDVEATSLDTGGQPKRGDGLLTKYLALQPRRKVLVAALDDLTALSAKVAVEVAVRMNECVIVSQGLDQSVHGGASAKKEIDPANRSSVVLGSVAYYLDHYGYEVLPLAVRVLKGETIPARTVTRHRLVTGANIFREYPPTDMN
ncbi:MAG: ribose transport system substrate-binding protein [Acetobacteraceae bacterium]|nr:ribose transport system substrate-binding protein [Acetobacteraceae bacterium]